MLNAVIIEDEVSAMDQLGTALSSVADDVKITSRLDSVSKSIEYISHKPAIDIVFSAIQLSDGLSFEIFNHTNICTPVIFVADDEEFMLDAFEYNCIAYLLRPVDTGRLRRALAKYRMLNDYFHTGYTTRDGQDSGRHTKHRMLVKKGKESISLPINDIVLFHTVHRTVYVTDYLGQEYIADKNLCDIEQELDKDQFFRVNRQYIVNINFIHSFKPYERVKLMIELTRPEINHHVIVSQEMAPQFREWMYNA
jgi:DNA-binding LytR/AlgR family response regulator